MKKNVVSDVGPFVFPSEVQVGLGGWLREVRESVGMSRIELGERIGLGVSTIQAVEDGGNPTFLVLVKLMRGLGLKMQIKKIEASR